VRTVFLALIAAAALRADTGEAAWLAYKPLPVPATLPAVVVLAGSSPVELTARDELIRGIRDMFGRTERIEQRIPSSESSIVLGTVAEVRGLFPDLPSLGAEAFCLKMDGRNIVIAGGDARGVLYGTFAFLRRLVSRQPMGAPNEVQTPYASIRWVNHWDNLDGTIERGYGGASLFFENGRVRSDLSRARDYARLLASLGINGCAINNVNADPKVISPEFLPQVAKIADVFRPWGIRLVLSVDFGSPKRAGGLDTFDPADPRVAAWWNQKAAEIYRAIPDLGGFLMKADSEGRVGPSAYGRTHADAANTIARALKPHGGLLFYRAFVYDHNLDWRNLKNDRARAAYDNFHPLDGKFDDNVVIQIKNGPIDFQVREPASPLFGGLEKTNQAIELQITQEYFGQARHTVYLAPMWKDVLDTYLYAGCMGTPVKALAAGKVFSRPVGGFVGVSNAGMDDNWFGNHLSQANLYAFGRLAWNPDLSSDEILTEWTRQTFGDDPKVNEVINTIQSGSWRTYENYTGPLGLQTLTAITGTHFGPAVEASERNGWGQWHRSDEHGTGMDRTVATGTGYIGQYRPPLARIYESAESCPDELILFMHHVPYTHVLNSGKTVIQTIYDLHYDGAGEVARWVELWKTLQGRVDERRYNDVLAQLQYQAGHAIEWRDAVNTWFLRTSGIPDEKKHAGTFPGRIEAENMTLDGYAVVAVTPWEAASGGKAIECKARACSASLHFDGKPGWYTLRIRYFDQIDGVSHFRVSVAGQAIDQWSAADHLPSRRIDSASSSLRVVSGVALRPGDEIRIDGVPDDPETAAVDYIEIVE
jgi:alpha-glucuronidase